MNAIAHSSPVLIAADRYHSFVEWSDEDACYIGYCLDLFPFGGVCHGDDAVSTFAELRQIVEEEVEDLIADGDPLPLPKTRPLTLNATA